MKIKYPINKEDNNNDRIKRDTKRPHFKIDWLAWKCKGTLNLLIMADSRISNDYKTIEDYCNHKVHICGSNIAHDNLNIEDKDVINELICNSRSISCK